MPEETREQFIAIDPGLRMLGAAYFYQGALQVARLVRVPGDKANAAAWCSMARAFHDELGGFPAKVLVYEMMQRDRRSSGARVDAIMQLCGIIGACAMGYEGTAGYYPSTWNKNRPKAANQLRILRALNEREVARLLEQPEFKKYKGDYSLLYDETMGGSAGLCSDVLDAVGIGLYHAGRL